MKVLQINTTQDIKTSTGRTMMELHSYLKFCGHESDIVYAQGVGGVEGVRLSGKLDAKWHALCARITGLEGYFSVRSTKRLLKYIDVNQPDIIRIANVHSNYINLPMLFAKIAEKNIPIVITLDDCWYYTGKCTHYTAAGCYKWQTKCGGCPKLKDDIPSYFFDKTSKMLFDKKEWYRKINKLGVVGVSEWIVSEAKKSILIEAQEITRIYNWIDLEVFSPREELELKKILGVQDKKIILAIASVWGTSKGLDIILEISRNIDNDTVVILVGEVQRNIDRYHNIIAVGSIQEPSKLAKYYNISDVFINMSKEESFGKVTAEALACGIPAVVLDSTASPEVVGMDCGYVAQKDNVKDVLNGIELIIQRGKKYYSEACRKRAEEEFAPEKCMRQYVELFERLLNEG